MVFQTIFSFCFATTLVTGEEGQIMDIFFVDLEIINLVGTEIALIAFQSLDKLVITDRFMLQLLKKDAEVKCGCVD